MSKKRNKARQVDSPKAVEEQAAATPPTEDTEVEGTEEAEGEGAEDGNAEDGEEEVAEKQSSGEEDLRAEIERLKAEKAELAARNKEQAQYIAKSQQAATGSRRADPTINSQTFLRDAEQIQGDERPHERDYAPSAQEVRILRGNALGPCDRLILDTRNLTLRQTWKVQVSLPAQERASLGADAYEVAFSQGRAHVPAPIANILLQQDRYRQHN